MKCSVFLTLLLISACTSNHGRIAEYRADAEAYCNIHDPKYWKKTGELERIDKLDSSQRPIAVYNAIHSSMKTDQMKNTVFLTDENWVPLHEYYAYLQKEIPKLTGQPFDCPAVKEFYTPGDPNSP